MFTWLNKQGVRSAEGFEVQRTGRFDATYRDGGKVVTLYVEPGRSAGSPCLIVDPGAFDHWDDGESITSEQGALMFSNLRNALEFQGLRLVVERGAPPPVGARIVEL